MEEFDEGNGCDEERRSEVGLLVLSFIGQSIVMSIVQRILRTRVVRYECVG